MHSAMVRKLRTYRQLPLFVQLWLPLAWLLLGVARWLILHMAFARLAPWLGQSVGASPFVPLLSGAQQVRAMQVGHVVRVAARFTPWTSNCFPQALVARWLLGLYGVPYTLCFGLQRAQGVDDVQAHAWVASGPVAVTGGRSFGLFTVVGVFATPGVAGP